MGGGLGILERTHSRFGHDAMNATNEITTSWHVDCTSSSSCLLRSQRTATSDLDNDMTAFFVEKSSCRAEVASCNSCKSVVEV